MVVVDIKIVQGSRLLFRFGDEIYTNPKSVAITFFFSLRSLRFKKYQFGGTDHRGTDLGLVYSVKQAYSLLGYSLPVLRT